MTTVNTASKPKVRPDLPWHVALWAAQLALAAMFAFAGYFKLFTPAEALVQQLPPGLPLALARFIGAAELAGAVGVILPAATRVLPFLTPLAAAGLAAVVVLATLFHTARGEFWALPITVGLAVLAAFVAWGRRRKAPIAPRG